MPTEPLGSGMVVREKYGVIVPSGDKHALLFWFVSALAAQHLLLRDEHAGEADRQQTRRDGRKALRQIPVPGMDAVLRRAAAQQVELCKLPRRKQPPAGVCWASCKV